MRVGLITCKVLPEPDPDAAPLDAALREHGHEPVMLAWDDTAIRFEDAAYADLDIIVIRSPWNYFTAPTDFLVWILEANECAPVINSPDVVKWNHHKNYLIELESAGVPTVPTRLVRMRDRDSIVAAIAEFGDVVIKPAIGAGSFNARRFAKTESASALSHASAILRDNHVLVQPHIAGFENPGERSLVWIDGEWTHAVRKRPRFEGQDESVDASEPPTQQELEIAEAAIHAVPHKIHYARADMVETNEGPVLSELELMEPSLFFDHSPAALERFVTMIERLGERNE